MVLVRLPRASRTAPGEVDIKQAETFRDEGGRQLARVVGETENPGLPQSTSAVRSPHRRAAEERKSESTAPGGQARVCLRRPPDLPLIVEPRTAHWRPRHRNRDAAVRQKAPGDAADVQAVRTMVGDERWPGAAGRPPSCRVASETRVSRSSKAGASQGFVLPRCA